MTILLDRLPYFRESTLLDVRGESVRVKGYQIVVWVSVSVKGLPLPHQAARLPAILDSANNHNFFIQKQHLVRWMGVQPERFRRLGTITERGKRLPLLAADVWLYGNKPGQREVAAHREPFRLALDEGMTVYPDDGSNYPRLPLLGLRSLTHNQLYLVIDGHRREVSLRTKRTWWFFS